MRSDGRPEGARRGKTPEGGARVGVMLFIGIVVMASAMLVWHFGLSHSPSGNPAVMDPPEAGTTPANGDETPKASVEATGADASPAGISQTTPADSVARVASGPGAPGAAPKHPSPSPYTQALVQNLRNIDISRGSLSPEQVSFWKQEYKKLVDAGPDGVPAIRELLEQNVNVDFTSLQNGNQLGARNLREALFDVLGQTGGIEANSLMADIMQTTANPEELAMLASRLQATAPGEYSDAIVAAARNALANATLNSKGAFAGVDMSPVFETLQKFGGQNALSDFQQAASKWNYYGPLGLASLPDGAGVGTLVQLAANSDGASGASSRLALRLLAQLAPQYPDAVQALVAQIGNNAIPDSAWVGITAALGGEYTYYGQGIADSALPTNGTDPKGYHLAANNQNYRSLNLAGNWTPAQIQQQLTLIDQLSAASPVAAKKLQAIRATLAARLSQ